MTKPAGGYDFAAKDTYRRRLWGAVDQFLTKPKRYRTVVYLDTSEGLETRHLLSLGYDPSRMYAVNRNPAEVAVLTRRLRDAGLKDVHTLGVELVEALSRIRDQIDVLNFDSTSTLHDGNKTELKLCALKVTNGGVLAMTFIAGREQGFQRDVVRALEWDSKRSSFNSDSRESHQSRVALAWGVATGLEGCFTHVAKLKWDVYISSSGLPMLWTVGLLQPHSDDAMRRWRKTHNLNRIGCAFPPTCVCESDEMMAKLKDAMKTRPEMKVLALSELEHK